mmetsp:Transcript_85498/g.204911  ORF Transcript_85498/g.204911 Transcript_85498/m.204911 type:complete len:320 (+) Transcript_85498:414-1373(+)
MLLAHLLSLVGAIEVLRRQGALSARHVPADDEVGGPEVLADDHVLDGLPRPSHLHGVGQVGPPEVLPGPLLVLRLLLQNLVGLDPCRPVDVPGLRWSTCWMDQNDGVLNVLVGVHQQLEVRLVHRVAVLESHHRLSGRQPGPHLLRRLEPLAPHQLKALHQSMHLAAHVELAQVRKELSHRRVLDFCGAIGRLCLLHLVGLPHILHIQHRELGAFVGQQHLRPSQALVIDVQDYRQSEEVTRGQPHVLHHGSVVGFRHEAGQGRKSAIDEEGYVAGLSLRQLQGCSCRCYKLLLVSTGDDRTYKDSTMWFTCTRAALPR